MRLDRANAGMPSAVTVECTLRGSGGAAAGGIAAAPVAMSLAPVTKYPCVQRPATAPRVPRVDRALAHAHASTLAADVCRVDVHTDPAAEHRMLR